MLPHPRRQTPEPPRATTLTTLFSCRGKYPPHDVARPCWLPITFSSERVNASTVPCTNHGETMSINPDTTGMHSTHHQLVQQRVVDNAGHMSCTKQGSAQRHVCIRMATGPHTTKDKRPWAVSVDQEQMTKTVAPALGNRPFSSVATSLHRCRD